MKALSCYKAEVVTTNITNKTTYGVKEKYLVCEHGFIYVLGCCFADVEKIVKPDAIKSIERVGWGYIGETE